MAKKKTSKANPFSDLMHQLYLAGFVPDERQREELGISPPPKYSTLRGEAAEFSADHDYATDVRDDFQEFICSYDLRFGRQQANAEPATATELRFHLDYECIYPLEHYGAILRHFKSIGLPVERVREFVCILNFETRLGLVSYKVGTKRFVINTMVCRDWADSRTVFRMLQSIPRTERKLATIDREDWFYLRQDEFDGVSKVFPIEYVGDVSETSGLANLKSRQSEFDAMDADKLCRRVRFKDRKSKDNEATKPTFIEFDEALQNADLQVKPANRRVKAWCDAIWCEDSRIEDQLVSDLRGNRGLDVLQGGCAIADGALRGRRRLAGLIVNGFREEVRLLFDRVESSKTRKSWDEENEWQSKAWRPSLQFWEASRWFGVRVRRQMVKNLQLDGFSLKDLDDPDVEPSLGGPVQDWIDDH